MESYTAATALALCHKIINTACSPTIGSKLTKAWEKSLLSENVMAVQKKLSSDLDKALSRKNSKEDLENMKVYLQHLQKTHEIKLNKSEQKGLVKEFGSYDLTLANRFLKECSYNTRVSGKLSEAQFYFHEVFSAMAYYLVAKDTIESGTKNSPLNNIIDALFESKPVTFFETGYPLDLLVHDRLDFEQAEPGFNCILRCDANHISTRQLSTSTAQSGNQDYLFYKITA